VEILVAVFGQSTRDALRERHVKARNVEGGIEAWCNYAKKKNPTATTAASRSRRGGVTVVQTSHPDRLSLLYVS